MTNGSTAARAMLPARRARSCGVILQGATGNAFTPISDRILRRFQIEDADAGK